MMTHVIGVDTAIPAFIGYTPRAGQTLTPTLVRSLAEFQALFGGEDDTPVAAGVGRRPFYLAKSLRAFYENGGDRCYIVSVGSYADSVDAARLAAGLDAIEGQSGPTMLVVPDALLLPAVAGFSSVAQEMLNQCGRLGDRVAILDVFGADTLAPNDTETLVRLVTAFHEAVGAEHLDYGVAYFPCLSAQANGGDPPDVVPASGVMAGVYTSVDANRGVWSAPANVSIAGVTGATFAITDAIQQTLTVPADGKAINAIRDFAGKGTLVWGARTLDGNSSDDRYVNVRRTVIFIDQSIKGAVAAFEFAANDANTWRSVVSLVANFLERLWAQGGLAGASASEAFSVSCGLGSTMTADDILAGNMKVQVAAAIVHAAEFIELTFTQKMRAAQ